MRKWQSMKTHYKKRNSTFLEKEKPDGRIRYFTGNGWKSLTTHLSSQTSEWLMTAHLKPTTEALITAAQDQALNTNWHSCHILKTKQTDKCM